MQTKEVVLKDGRKVTMKELSALEDVQAYRFVGKDFDEDNKFGGGVTVRSIQVALAVEKIDGKNPGPMQKLEDVFAFMAGFGKKDWGKLTEAYYDLNEADDEGE